MHSHRSVRDQAYRPARFDPYEQLSVGCVVAFLIGLAAVAVILVGVLLQAQP